MQNEDNLRHSCAHLLAAAIIDLYPGAQNAIGPAIENGFYQDFDLGDTTLSENDFKKIEEKMREILKNWNAFEVKEVDVEQAKKDFAWNKYKLELIEEFAKTGKTITENNPGNFLDLCKGGHSSNPKEEMKHFKLLSVAGAYWKGSEKNKMLTRIYGTCFSTKDELSSYLVQLEEAKKRDHKKLGRDLDLFVFSDLVGKGLPLWTIKGSIVRRELERFIVDEEIKRNYFHVYTPDIARIDLYKTSGHYPYYKESMYTPIQIEDEEFMLRPMTCPHHFELYKSQPHSYRELPMRLAELAKLYRFEKSGELMGLLRVRSFCLADAHIITQSKQAGEIVNEVLDLIEYVADVLGFRKNEDYWYRLSLGDREDEVKYFKSDADWDTAEGVLRDAVGRREVKNVEAANEAAFYGPKIDVQMRNIHGKEDTAFTVQYDFVMPKRFELKFINDQGQEEEPVVIHRSSIGAIERIIAFLIERYAGAFPLWLSPVQFTILPVSEKFHEFAKLLHDYCVQNGIRSYVSIDNKTLGAKIREATLQKVPYICIIGEKELEGKRTDAVDKDTTISTRTRSGEEKMNINFYEFINQLRTEIETKQK